MKAYNGLKIKDIYQKGDSTTRPKPDWVIMGLGDGAKDCCYEGRRAGETGLRSRIRMRH